MPPLSGIRVLDLTRHLPGPYGTMILADCGADVIKIEDPQGGDPLRQMKNHIAGMSEVFDHVNRGKRSLTLNLRSEAGKALFLKLLARGDVLVEGFRPGVMQRLGFDYAALKDQFPRLIYCSISGFGQTGERKDLPGHDLNYMGTAGMLRTSTDAPAVAPMPPTLLADLQAGLCAALGIVLALHERTRTGQGQNVDVDMTRSLAPFLLPWLGLTSPDSPSPNTWFCGGLAAYNVYRTKDGGMVTLAALEHKFWKEFCDAAGRPDLADGHLEPRRQPELQAEVARVIESRSQQEWLDLAARHDMCLGPVRTPHEAITDSYLRYQGWPNPFPLAVSAAGPPELGAHTQQILGDELGESPDAVQNLRAQGIV